MSTGITLDTVEGYKWRVELIYREMLAKEIVSGQLLDAEKNALDCFAKAFEAINYFRGWGGGGGVFKKYTPPKNYTPLHNCDTKVAPYSH